MLIQKYFLSIKIIFEDPRIIKKSPQKLKQPLKVNSKSSPINLSQTPSEQKPTNPQPYQHLKNCKAQLIEQFPIKQCLNEYAIGRYKPIILQRLLRRIQQMTNMSFQGHKIFIYLPKPQLYMNCDNYPLNQNVLIRGKDYLQDQVMTIVAKKRGQFNPQLIPALTHRIQLMQSQKLKTMTQKIEPDVQFCQHYQNQNPVDNSFEEKQQIITQKIFNDGARMQLKANLTTHTSKEQALRSSKGRKKYSSKELPMDPLDKLKGNVKYVEEGMSKFQSFVFCDVKQLYDIDRQYKFEVERTSRIKELRYQSQKNKIIHKKNTDQQDCKGPVPKRDRNMDYNMKQSYHSNEENLQDNTNKNTKLPSLKNGRRLNERRIGNVIDKVVEWTRWICNYREKWLQLRPHQSDKYEDQYSKEDAALIVDIPKKTLDDYLFNIVQGLKYRFNFNEHCMDRFAVLRMFVSKSRKEEKKKQNQFINEQNYMGQRGKKRLRKKKKAEKKRQIRQKNE